MRIETFDGGALGAWTLTMGYPSHLAGLVADIWHFEGLMHLPRERHLPNGMLDLVLQLGGERYSDVYGAKREVCPMACVGGMQTGAMVIEAPEGRSTVLGLRLHPAGAYALLGQPLSEISGQTVDLRDLIGAGSTELIERCLQVSSGPERVHVVSDWVSRSIARSRRIDPAIAWMTHEIERYKGAVAIGSLRERIGMSKTRLVLAFRQQIGVTPKLYGRIVRFRNVLEILHMGGESLADVAIEAGYYDQPHMNAEFRELSGFTPLEFLAKERFSATSLPEPREADCRPKGLPPPPEQGAARSDSHELAAQVV